jgi:hypothetical protein
MIPPLTLAGLIPPFSGTTPVAPGAMSPYLTTMEEITRRFCTTAHRANLLRGLLSYRRAMIAAGVTNGAQWINGSFCEDCETTRGAPPGDIDIVSLLVRPPAVQNQPDWVAFLAANPELFDPATAKRVHHCEAFFIEIQFPAAFVGNQLTYWFGLFTHHKHTFAWKGLLQVPLGADDTAAEAYLNALALPP